MFGRVTVFVFGAIAYLLFLGTFLYTIGFVGDLLVPRSISHAPRADWWIALPINLGILALFAIQHTIMARPAFKRQWTRLIPPAAERSVFVLLASLILCLLYWQWRAMPGVIWHLDDHLSRMLILGCFTAGWLLVLYSTFAIDHFDLFGLRQVWLHLRGKPYTHQPFMQRTVYRMVRHPLMLGFLLAFWSAPTMTTGRLVFAIMTTLYILVGILFEERDLLQQHGEAYRRYRDSTPALIPFARRASRAQPAQTRSAKAPLARRS